MTRASARKRSPVLGEVLSVQRSGIGNLHPMGSAAGPVRLRADPKASGGRRGRAWPGARGVPVGLASPRGNRRRNNLRGAVSMRLSACESRGPGCGAVRGWEIGNEMKGS